MRNKYLLLGAASALMLAACSEDIKGPEANNKPVENALNLTSLSPASQAGRVSLPGQTRGLKANRLQLVAKIAPVSESMAADHNWSATGITVSNGNAFVSWHSNHQAKVAADKWGGAIDVIDIAALKADRNADVITNTYLTQAVKFNNIVAGNSGTFYLPVTSYSNGAVVARWTRGSLAMDTISLPGSSANAISVGTTDLFVATGYKGGVYSVPVAFDAESEATEIMEYAEEFGGKYIDGGFLLRTDDSECEIVPLLGGTSVKGAPLVSAEKNAEIYDGETGQWEVKEDAEATHYGKHTMAVDEIGGYIYVGGGKGSNGANGLRVYDLDGLKWDNGTNTTAVCVDGDYVYAATGAGLRVYEKFNGTELPLYAFEVLDYDADGNAADHENLHYPVAGTDAHSPNFVAVGEGLIFVACGQSGVYVFKLNHEATSGETKQTGFVAPGVDETEEVEVGETKEFTVPDAPEDSDFDHWKGDDGEDYTPGDEIELPAGKVVELTPVYKKLDTGFKIEGGDSFTEEVEKGKNLETKVPAAPTTAPEGKEFDKWIGNDGNEYTPGEDKTISAGTVIVLTPVWKDIVYTYTVTFNLNGGEGDVPAAKSVQSNNPLIDVPAQGNIKRDGFLFMGWAEKEKVNMDDDIYKNGETQYEVKGNVTLYAVWGKQGSVTGTPDAEGDEF